MSDESETSTKPSGEPKPKTRRPSTPRSKKVAKTAKVTESTVASADEAVVFESPKFPEFPESSEAPSSNTNWPEPEAASSGATAQSEAPKRKRRRKKGKGGGVQSIVLQTEVEDLPKGQDESVDPAAPKGQAPRPQQQPRPRFDGEILAKCAWKIFLAEISEEGVALVGDNDAKELSRRCFRLAEIFLEEQSRRR